MSEKGYEIDNRDLYVTHLNMADGHHLVADPWGLVINVIENSGIGDMRQDELIADIDSIRHKLEEAVGYVEEHCHEES